jgi:hypothetical protein
MQFSLAAAGPAALNRPPLGHIMGIRGARDARIEKLFY